MTAHAKLSASGADRWLTCPGSVAAEAGIKRKSSGYAEEGTAAHDLGERCLRADVDATDYLGQTMEGGFVVSQDMASHVQSYVDYVKNVQHSLTSADLFVEQRVAYTNWVPDGFGTADAVIISQADKVCHVIDLKYGKGVEVSADDNSQLKMYALGVLQKYAPLFDIETFVLHVVQPRIGNYSEWSISAKDLHQFGRYARAQARIALSEDAPRKADEKACRWCAAKAECPTLFNYTQTALMIDFDDLTDAPAVERLTLEQKRQVLDNKALIDTFMKAIEADAFDTLVQTGDFPGYKLVEGRSVRKWNDDAESVLLAKLGEDAYERKLLGITAAEKLIGKKELTTLGITEKPPGKPTLATESDRRKALTVQTCETLFEII